jgi:hypothetical protein
MKRLLYTIESTKGFLADIERYTDNILDAVTFVDFDNAAHRLAQVNDLLVEPCWIVAKYVPFPRPIAVCLDTYPSQK